MSPGFTPVHRGGDGSPLVLLHGVTDTWRTWELVLPRLERRHAVLAPTLAGHAGGPPLGGAVTADTLPDAVERALDEAGIESAHLVGNSLGGYVAFQLAARGRARSVVALAPAGGWAVGDAGPQRLFALQARLHEQTTAAAPHAEAIVATARGRRRATELITTSFEQIPAELIAHQIRGSAACDLAPLLAFAATSAWPLDAERISCPVRIVWGTADRLLPWPSAAERYRGVFPQADWVELDGVGHCPQLDVPLETAELVLGFTPG